MKIRISAANNRITDKRVTSREREREIKNSLLIIYSSLFSQQNWNFPWQTILGSRDYPRWCIRLSVMGSRETVAADVQELGEKRGNWTEHGTRLWQALLNAHSLLATTVADAGKTMLQLSVTTNPSALSYWKKQCIWNEYQDIHSSPRDTNMAFLLCSKSLLCYAIRCRWPTMSDQKWSGS